MSEPCRLRRGEGYGVCDDEVVNKCALPGREEAPRIARAPLFSQVFRLARLNRYSRSSSKLKSFVSGITLSRIAPFWINLRVLALRSFFRSRACASSKRCRACTSCCFAASFVIVPLLSGTHKPIVGIIFFWNRYSVNRFAKAGTDADSDWCV